MNDLTIIIPSIHRHNFLKRSVKYWNNYDFQVIIVDGSNNSLKEWIDINAKKNIKYIYKKTTFPKRLNLAAKLIKTKYTILACDDEFYSAYALRKCINFLELNNEFVAVNGNAIGFAKKNNELVFFDVYPNWVKRENIKDDPKDRIVYHMKNYANTLGVSVVKSSLWKKNAKFYSNHEFPIFAQWEFQMNLILSFVGKSKTLDVIMHFRSLEQGSISIPMLIKNHTPSLNLKNQISHFWTENIYEKQKKDYIILMSEFLKKLKPKYKFDYCKDALVNSIEKYLESRFAKQNLKKTLFYKVKYFIKNITKLISFYLLKIEIHQSKSLENILRLFIKRGIIINQKDLKRVISLINNFYNMK